MAVIRIFFAHVGTQHRINTKLHDKQTRRVVDSKSRKVLTWVFLLILLWKMKVEF